ncbi:MAG: cation transporter [Clostridium sp.]|nr:cation transporter [Clostridium sp.]
MKEINKSVDTLNEKKIAMRVSVVSIIVNLLLSLIKLFAGIFAKSSAMISDAIHSASDVFSTFVVIIGVNIANKQSDKEHQYGHERLECVAAIILAIVLAVTGIGIGIDGIKKILAGNYGDLEVPGVVALIAAVMSILVKEWMYWYTRRAAKKINSSALMADAWHHRSDSLSSIGAFIGILASRIGYPIFDPIASVIICIFIIKAAYDIFKDSIDKLVDKSCDEKTVEKIKEVIMNQDGVIGIDLLRTRLFGSKIYVDVEISADGNKPLKETHAIAEKVHDAIENEFKTVKHCMVHVNPDKEE